MKHFKQRLKDHDLVFSKVAEDYMRDPFNQRHIEAFKKMFKGFPYSVNMHTLTNEQVARLNEKNEEMLAMIMRPDE